MILPEQLRTFDYYRKKIPHYLQQSYGFEEHFKLWLDAMVGSSSQNLSEGLVPTWEKVLELLSILDEDYVTKLQNVEGYNNSSDFDLLNKIGSLYGVTRNMSVVVNGEEIQLSLTNDEFLKLIKARVKQASYDGSLTMLLEMYKDIGLDVWVTWDTGPADADPSPDNVLNLSYRYIVEVILYTYQKGLSSNIKNLFLAGELAIKAMGIPYKFRLQEDPV